MTQIVTGKKAVKFGEVVDRLTGVADGNVDKPCYKFAPIVVLDLPSVSASSTGKGCVSRISPPNHTARTPST
ncbi:hypothetical protein ACNKHM_25840 [Shigella sonnei]